jgi:DivIVA domain-containing protein
MTPHDVRMKQFNPSGLVRKGYDETEVDDFLDEVVAALSERDATIDRQAERIASLERDAATQRSERPDADAGSAASSPETVTTLLAMAQRTAEDHIAAGAAAAAASRAEAERAAAETTGAAQAEARRLLSEAETERRRLLADLQEEQRQLATATGALRTNAERAREHLTAYLQDALATLEQPALPQQPPELKALSA